MTRVGSRKLTSSSIAPLASPLDVSEKEMPLTWKTKTIKKLDENTYVFYCTARVTTARINRNMVIIENKGDLTVIDPLKLTAEGTQKIAKLGRVKHIVRLGSSPHAYLEDGYYLELYPYSLRWAPGTFTENSKSRSLPIDRQLKDKGTAPVPGCRVFVFQHTSQPEAVLLLERQSNGNLLITGGCLQSQKQNEFVNTPTVAKMKLNGLLESDVVVSPPWLKVIGPPPTAGIQIQKNHMKNMRKDFQRLLGLRFNRLLSTSGNLVKYSAYEAAILAVEFAFPLWSSSRHMQRRL